jgi:predicted nuclease of restriction endonuclease-like RecB superfamily
MLTGNLVRVKTTSKGRVMPLYLNREDPRWLEVAESLLLIFREGVGLTRGEVESEIEELIGEGMATLAHRGLAKVLEDRAEFEVVADVPPETVREKVFLAAAEQRKSLKAEGLRKPFRRDLVVVGVAKELGIEPAQVTASQFADH